MCFDRNINGNRDVKFFEWDYWSLHCRKNLTLIHLLSQSSSRTNLARNLRNAFTLKVQGTYLLRILQAIINDSTYLAQKITVNDPLLSEMYD